MSNMSIDAVKHRRAFGRFMTLLWALVFTSSVTLPVVAAPDAPAADDGDEMPIALAIHGGAGTIDPSRMTPEREARYRGKLNEALDAGYAILEAGGASLDAVIAAVEVLENSPLFNAGVGAVYTWEGSHELDASLMVGDSLAAGAVAGVKTIASPIRAARAVMEQSPHVLLSGDGADTFARSQGLVRVPNSHFDTPARREALERVREERKVDHSASLDAVEPNWRFGTVGAVALDRSGTISAGTSTGGMTAKRWGRIGDSPLIGAGTYADNRSCAVSATGHGEYFIRFNVAADICARVRYLNLDIAEAGRQVIFDELKPAGGTGGVIIVDPTGQVAMPFNTSGMYRGSIDASGNRRVAIYADDPPAEAADTPE
ncbi:MAG: isoaspartyl peptidase/L-asparaginase [Pseudomonadota bacterium]